MSTVRVHLGAERKTDDDDDDNNNNHQNELRDPEKSSVRPNGLSLSPALHCQHTVKQYKPIRGENTKSFSNYKVLFDF